MEVVSWPGFPPQSRVIPPLVMTTMFVMGLRTEALFQLLAWGTGGISTVVKGFVQRPRPLPEQVRVVLAPLGGSSFPSGHVLTYVGTYGFMAFLVYSVIRPPLVRWPLSRRAWSAWSGWSGRVASTRATTGRRTLPRPTCWALPYLIALMALYRRVKGRQA